MESCNKFDLIMSSSGTLNNCNDIGTWFQYLMVFTGDFSRHKIDYNIIPVKTRTDIKHLKDMQFITEEHVSEWWEIIQNNKYDTPSFMTKNNRGNPIFRICKITPDLFFVSVFCQKINDVYFIGVFKANLGQSG